MPPPNLNAAENKRGSPPLCTAQQAQQAGVTHHPSLCLHSGQKCIGQNCIYSGAGTDPGLQLWQVVTQSFGGSDQWAVLPLPFSYRCLLSCTLPSLWILPSLTFPHNYFPTHLRFPKWRGWPKNPVSEHLHAAVPAQKMLMGIGKLTAQIATDGKYFLHIEHEGVGSGKAVALPWAVLQKLGTRGVTPPLSPSTPAGVTPGAQSLPKVPGAIS